VGRLRRSTTERAVTIKDLAAHCGIGVGTVSRALSGAPSVKPTTRERVLAAARELGYDPAQNDAARRLRFHGHGYELMSRTIALLLSHDAGEIAYFSRILHGVIDEFTRQDYTLVLMMTESASQSFQLPPLLSRGDLDGLVLMPGILMLPCMKELMRHPMLHGRPVVSLLEHFTDLDPCSSYLTARIDVGRGAYQASRHLLELGHRHVLHFAVPSFDQYLPYRERRQGVEAALREFALDPATHLHSFPLPQYLTSAAWADPRMLHTGALTQLLERYAGGRTHPLPCYLREHPEITALLALNDASAIAAWYTLEGAGFRVPEEISIVGFDDTDPMIGPQGDNLLTTVHLPLPEIAQAAVRLLIRHIEEEQPEETSVLLQPELVVRASTGRVQGG